MKQIVFILFIFLILPFCVHAKKAVFGYSGSYWEGYSLEELNINEYKKKFSGSGKLKLHGYTLSGFGRKKCGFLPELEGRINLEHLSLLNKRGYKREMLYGDRPLNSYWG